MVANRPFVQRGPNTLRVLHTFALVRQFSIERSDRFETEALRYKIWDHLPCERSFESALIGGS